MTKKKRVVSAKTRKKLSDAAKARHAKKKEIKIETTDEFKTALANFSEIKLVKKLSCRRHPDVSRKTGESCPKCITACLRHNAMMVNKTFILPCPTCMNSTREEDGGCIKTYYSKPDHYGCGHCKISYNLKGEKVTWESGKDETLFNREIIHRK